MAEMFDFGIGIRIDPGDSVKNLRGVIDHVDELQRSVEAFNAATDLGSRIGAEATSGAAGGESSPTSGAITETPNAPDVGVFEEMRDILRDISMDIGEIADGLYGSSDAAQEFSKGMENIEDVGEGVKKSSDKLNESLSEGKNELDKIVPKWWEFGSAGETSLEIVDEAVGGFAISILDLNTALQMLAMHGAFLLEREAVRLGVRLGTGAEGAAKFTTEIEQMAKKTHFAEMSVAGVAQMLASMGESFESLSESQGPAAAEFLVHLNSSLGMGVEQLRVFTASARLMGTSVVELGADALAFEQGFKIPGLLEQLPAITATVIKTQQQFGKSTVQNAAMASRAVTRMAGIYAKALGKTAAEAAQDAMESFQQFAGETRSYQDVFLGLADSFTPLQTALLETGRIGVDELGPMMERAQTDQAGFREEILRVRDSLQPQQAARFMRQVIMSSTDGMAAILNMTDAQWEAQEAASDAADKAAEDREKDEAGHRQLMGTLAELRENTIDQYEMFAEALSNIVARVFRIFGPGLTEGFGQLVGWVDRFTIKLEEGESALGAIEGSVGGFNTTIAAVTLGTGGFATTLGAMASGAGFAWKFIKPLWTGLKGGLKIISSLFNGVNKVGGKVPGLTKIFGGAIGKFLIIPGLIIAAIEPVKKAFGVISDIISGQGSTWDKLKGIVGASLTAVWETIDSFLMGLPGMFLDGFLNVGKKTETEGAESFGKSIGKFLGKGIEAITTFFIDLVTVHIPEGWAAVKAWWNDLDIYEDLLLPIVSGFAALGDNIIAFAKGMAEGFLESFGVPAAGLVPVMQIIWLKIQKFFTIGFYELADGFMDAISGWKIVFNDVGSWISASWESITSRMKSLTWDFVAAGIAGFDRLLLAAQKGGELIGVDLELIEAGRNALHAAEAYASGRSNAIARQSQEALSGIERERVARNRQILDEKRIRDEATASAAANFDQRISQQQSTINRLAEEEAAQKRIAEEEDQRIKRLIREEERRAGLALEEMKDLEKNRNLSSADDLTPTEEEINSNAVNLGLAEWELMQRKIAAAEAFWAEAPNFDLRSEDAGQAPTYGTTRERPGMLITPAETSASARLVGQGADLTDTTAGGRIIKGQPLHWGADDITVNVRVSGTEVASDLIARGIQELSYREVDGGRAR